MAPPTAPQGCCALCSVTKSPSFRKNILPGKLICNACCCFLYRTVRGGQQDGANLSQAVTDLALRLLAGKGTLPSMTELRTKRHTRAAAWLGGSSASLEPGASSGGEESLEPPPRALQPPQARQPQTVVEHNHSKQGPEAQQLMFEVLQNLGSVAPQRDHDVTEPAGQDGHRRRLAWEAAQRQQAHRQATLKQARRGAPSGSQQVQPKQQAGKPEQTGLLCRVPSGGAAAAPAAGRGSPGLEGLREAAWRAAEDPKLAADAMMTAWRHGYALPGLKLPGVSPTPLGAAPSVWLLQADAGAAGMVPVPLPAGVLLLRVHQAPAGLTPEAQQMMLSLGRGLQSSLRLLVYSRRDGLLLQSRDWVPATQHDMAPHPRFGLPCWDSGEGWYLLFPDPSIERHQAELFCATLRAYGVAPQAPQLPTSPMGSPSFPHTPFCHSLAFPGSSPAKAAVQLCPAAASHPISQLGPMPPSVEAPAGGGNRVSPFAAGQACPNAPAFAAHPGAAAMQPPPCWATTAGGAGSSALLPGVPSTADLGVVRPHASLSLSLQPSGGRSSPGEGSPMANSVSARPPLRSGADLATYEVVDAAYTDTWDPKGRSHSGVVGSDTFRAPPQAAAVAAELPSFAAAVEPAPSDVVAAPARSSPAAVPAGVQGSLGVVELPGADEKMLPLALNMSWDFDLDIAGLAGIAAC
ncbi:hypothetical protein ABPG77_002940 [Micractinium sp. CCAP 211/92]